MAILKIENVSFTYPTESEATLKAVNLQIEQGEFVVLMGKSGCGKSTLLKHLKRELQPHGEMIGTIYYDGKALQSLDDETSACDIGFVLQNPENQIVTDKVWHELAFGLENLGVDSLTIRRRVAEIANFFGIQNWFRKKTTELSGGQKQLLNLASVMAMQPKVLLLDEPTSQLDPIAAMEFIKTLQRLNEELGITIILIEHRLEEVLPIAQKVVVMDDGEIIFDGLAKQVLAGLPRNHEMVKALPSAMRVFHAFGEVGEAPLTIREGQLWLKQKGEMKKKYIQEDKITSDTSTLLEAKDISFRYEKNREDVLRNFHLKAKKGEIFSIIGGNGTGKSTALNILAGLISPYRGEVMIKGKKLKKYSAKELYQHLLGLLPQDPKTLFTEKTAKRELEVIAESRKLEYSKINQLVDLLKLKNLLQRHPYDLSGGEQQKLALAKVLLTEPEILLLDEPTKGLDAHAKEELGEILKALQGKGLAIVMVTHDIEFSAKYSSYCALFFDGNLVSEGEPRSFYTGNNFYTTAAHRISRHTFENTITCEDVIELCKENLLLTTV